MKVKVNNPIMNLIVKKIKSAFNKNDAKFNVFCATVSILNGFCQFYIKADCEKEIK